MAFLQRDQVAHLEALPLKEQAPSDRLGMGGARAERKAETLKGWRTMETKAGAERLHFLRGGKGMTVCGGDVRPDLLGLLSTIRAQRPHRGLVAEDIVLAQLSSRFRAGVA